MFSVFPLVIVATLGSELASVIKSPEEDVAINVRAISPTLAVAESNPKVIVWETLAVACTVRTICPVPPDAPAVTVPLEFRDPAPPPPGAKPSVPLKEPVVGPVPPLPPPAGAVAPTLLVALTPLTA
jgi:hypothetical protein